MPNGKSPKTWLIGVNLGLMLLVAVLSQGEPVVLAGTVVALAVINGIAAFLMAVSGKLNWVTAFLLSALLVFIIGLGICGLMLSNLGGMH
ncbi:hypothetical protein [Hymenobacter coccineus]|uniref:hypothetical protein n=1 Tax=Hymenobacter coccineus TaxID=1908235 RepID=UPI000F79BAB4|nr:hypothetical protein [Hymenobacter coccineus]